MPFTVCSAAMPALVRRTVRCPCGRRSSNVVLAEGQEPEPLPCTSECQRQQRRARLADAFGIGQPDNYVPVQACLCLLHVSIVVSLSS